MFFFFFKGINLLYIFFFFSSRRRHTRLTCDWSSDVCSSDLRPVPLRVETTNSPFTAEAQKGQRLVMPIAHGEGCYIADDRTLDQLEAEDRVVLRYLDNPNGSMRDIAGILNERRNVMGLMPHPERVSEPLMGSSDGLVILQSMVSYVAQTALPVRSEEHTSE